MQDYVENFKNALPKALRTSVTPALVEQVRKLAGDSEYAEFYTDNLVSYASVIKTGRYKVASYIHACKYVSHKLLGDSNADAYMKTFPSRYKRMVNKGLSDREISSFVAAYSKGQLVVKIMSQSIIPAYISNIDKLQKAIDREYHLMSHARSELVQHQAAAKLIDVLTPPEGVNMQLDVHVSADDTLSKLREVMGELAAVQLNAIQNKSVTIEHVAQSKITKDE